MTFTAFTNGWLKLKKPQLKPKTYMDYQLLIKNTLRPAFGSMKIEDISANLIDQFLSSKLDLGLAPSSISKYKATLHNIMEYAYRKGILAKNPVNQCEPIKKGSTKRSYIPNDDLKKIINSAKNITEVTIAKGRLSGQSAALYPVLLLLLHTGMRIGEVFALRWSNIDLEQHMIHIRATISTGKDSTGKICIMIGTPKTENSIRDISISQTAHDTLQKLYEQKSEGHDLVFATKTGTPISPENFSRIWRSLLESLGMKGQYTIHEFRHTHATQLIEAGFSILDVSKRLGHASPQTTVNVYAHAVAGADKKLGNFFDQPKKGSSQTE